MTTADPAAAMALPVFTYRKLTLLVTGSVNAALVPYWLHWLNQMYPDLTVSVGVSQMAQRFVQLDALRALTSGAVWADSWESADLPERAHIGIESQAECFGVFPATINTTMRLAAGFTDTPTLMALQLTQKPIAIASTFPGTNEIVKRRCAELELRPNLRFTGTLPAFSVSAGDWSGTTGFFMPLLLTVLEELRERSDDVPSPAEAK
ncbi:Flavoprotein [Microbacterium azadirachtae]|uniref:Flavoprotein n=1 Tax=Microbacterium azadirachtae TaxID=582680 RepID=A0A1I6FV76_9MICO|nr:flavoprotein [Microbacterium azadirachtae]SFR33852.1 Flavoprotein [Microbacterium azadirachtae]